MQLKIFKKYLKINYVVYPEIFIYFLQCNDCQHMFKEGQDLLQEKRIE